MKVDAQKKENAVLIIASGRLDATTASDFETECSKWISGGEKNMAVDLGGLEYISSAGLRSILSTGKKIKAQGGAIHFCKLAGMVKEVFDISGFASIFPVFDSQEEALAQLK